MNITKQYIAGFIDGEGYLGIIRKTNTKCTQGYYYKPVIKIAQTETASEILRLIKDRYGGNISKTREHKGLNQRGSVMLELTSGVRVKRVLDDIQPSLFVKSRQAEILRKFIKLPRVINSFSKDKKLKIDAIKTDLYRNIMVLNKRGLAETE